MKRIPLSLDPTSEQPASGRPLPEQAEKPDVRPIMGWLAVGLAILGIFTKGYIFVPVAFVCSLIALFMGQGAWAFGGLLLSVVGLMTSPVLLALLGLGALAAYVGLPA